MRWGLTSKIKYLLPSAEDSAPEKGQLGSTTSRTRTAEVQEGVLGGDTGTLETPQNSKLADFKTNYSMRWCVLYSGNAQLHGAGEFLSAVYFPEHALLCL